MIRAIKLKLYNTRHKQNILHNLIIRYRKAVNYYLQVLFHEGGQLDKLTLAKLQRTLLSERYKSQALKQALEIYRSCVNKKIKTHNKTPVFTGFPILDNKFVKIENGENSFDVWLKISTLRKGCKIYLPTKKTRVLNKWLNHGELRQGCELHKDKVIVWVKSEKDYKQEGEVVGLDLGMRKLISLSDGTFLGHNFTKLRQKIASKRKNSQGYKKAVKELHNYTNSCINKIDFSKIKILGYEKLTGITKGKSKFRVSKKFRKAQQHWSHRRIIARILDKCEENRVRPIYVNPRNSSVMCDVCGHVDKGNRKGEKFSCLRCSRSLDADLLAARNILARTLQFVGSLESPIASKR